MLASTTHPRWTSRLPRAVVLWVLLVGLQPAGGCINLLANPDASDVQSDSAQYDTTFTDLHDEEPQNNPDEHVVHIIYLIPTDRSVQSAYSNALERAILHVQRFYYDQVGGGVTFAVHDPLVEIVHTAHPASYYSETGDYYGFWDQVTEEGFALTGAQFDDPHNIWIFYIDADNACGQMGGGGTSGVAVMSANDLRGLAGLAGVPSCPDDPPFWYEFPPCRWIGGLAHELGHAFYLPHPPGCDEQLSTCDSDALMYLGYTNYPNTYLRADERSVLVQNPFFGPRGVAAPFDCN